MWQGFDKDVSPVKLLLMNLKQMMPAAASSLTLWYANALCLFFRVKLGVIMLLTTFWISPYKMVGSLSGKVSSLL